METGYSSIFLNLFQGQVQLNWPDLPNVRSNTDLCGFFKLTLFQIFELTLFRSDQVFIFDISHRILHNICVSFLTRDSCEFSHRFFYTAVNQNYIYFPGIPFLEYLHLRRTHLKKTKTMRHLQEKIVFQNISSFCVKQQRKKARKTAMMQVSKEFLIIRKENNNVFFFFQFKWCINE
jgi:hypothetical protein